MKHGDAPRNRPQARLYSIWRGMKSRCYGENNSAKHNYKDKGVTVCNEWNNSYEKFREWALANGYESTLTIDKDELCEKLNVHPKVYSPETCMWKTHNENCIIYLYTKEEEALICELYLANTPLVEIYSILGKGVSKSVDKGRNTIKSVLTRNKVWIAKYTREAISNIVIEEILNSEQLGLTLQKYGISRSKWYRAKQKYNNRI